MRLPASIAIAFACAVVLLTDNTAQATYITARTGLDFEVFVPTSIGHTYSDQFAILEQDKSPERVLLQSLQGTWATQLRGNLEYRTLSGWATVANITNPRLGDFGDIVARYVETVQFANPTDAASTFIVVPDWDPSLSIDSDINPNDLSEEADISSVASFSIRVRDQDGNIPMGWADVSHFISFGEGRYLTPGIRQVLVTVPAHSSTSFLTFELVTHSSVAVVAEPPTGVLSLLGLFIGGAYWRARRCRLE